MVIGKNFQYWVFSKSLFFQDPLNTENHDSQKFHKMYMRNVFQLIFADWLNVK